jgi:hypothetical protein
MQMFEVMAGMPRRRSKNPKIVDQETLRVLAALATISAHPTGPRLHSYATFDAQKANMLHFLLTIHLGLQSAAANGLDRVCAAVIGDHLADGV